MSSRRLSNKRERNNRKRKGGNKGRKNNNCFNKLLKHHVKQQRKRVPKPNIYDKYGYLTHRNNINAYEISGMMKHMELMDVIHNTFGNNTLNFGTQLKYVESTNPKYGGIYLPTARFIRIMSPNAQSIIQANGLVRLYNRNVVVCGALKQKQLEQQGIFTCISTCISTCMCPNVYTVHIRCCLGTSLLQIL